MKSKLTLSIDENLVDYAKQQARREGQSVSAMFSDYLMRRKKTSQSKVVSVDTMVGSLKNYQIDDSKQAIQAAYAQKYRR